MSPTWQTPVPQAEGARHRAGACHPFKTAQTPSVSWVARWLFVLCSLRTLPLPRHILSQEDAGGAQVVVSQQ